MVYFRDSATYVWLILTDIYMHVVYRLADAHHITRFCRLLSAGRSQRDSSCSVLATNGEGFIFMTPFIVGRLSNV